MLDSRQRNECVLGQPAGMRTARGDPKSEMPEIRGCFGQVLDEDDGVIK